MTHRFFIPPAWLAPPNVTLQAEIARQIRTVLRMKPGDTIIVLDNSGIEWHVMLTIVDKDVVRGQIIAQHLAQGEPTLQLTLYQGMLKTQKFEWVLQKGTELGISRFVPIICQRSLISNPEAINKKHRRWERIIQEAAEQSHRGKLPDLNQAMSFNEAIHHAQTNPLVLMAWEEMEGCNLKDALTEAHGEAIALFIGPEGGFTKTEAASARRYNLRLVHLGPRILRAETAGLATCAAIFYEMGEWNTAGRPRSY